jgi:hypothetical protein
MDSKKTSQQKKNIRLSESSSQVRKKSGVQNKFKRKKQKDIKSALFDYC